MSKKKKESEKIRRLYMFITITCFMFNVISSKYHETQMYLIRKCNCIGSINVDFGDGCFVILLCFYPWLLCTKTTEC